VRVRARARVQPFEACVSLDEVERLHSVCKNVLLSAAFMGFCF